MKVSKMLIKFLIVFLLYTLIVTWYFIDSFGSLADSLTLSIVIKTIKQFGLVISIPAAILFVIADIFVQKIKTVWFLYLTRCMVFFCLLWLVSILFSVYLITNSLLDNPFMK